MKKITKVIALLLVAVMLFSGCSKVELTTTIYSNGGAKVVSVWNLKKSEFDKFITEQLGYSDPDAYFESLKVGSYYENVTIDGEEYYQMRELAVVEAGDLFKDDLNMQLGISKNGLDITKDTVYGVVDSETVQSNTELFAMYTAKQFKTMGYDLNNMIKLTVAFEFPANIVSTNGTIDSTNPKKVTFNIDLNNKETVVFATTTNKTEAELKAAYEDENTLAKTKIKNIKIKYTKKKKAKAVVKIKTVSGAEEYQVQFSTNKNFKKGTRKNAWTWDGNKVTREGLVRGETYYVRARAIKYTYDYDIIRSDWTKPIKVKIEK